MKPSISASPAGGSPGEIMQVQLVSFPVTGLISQITLSGRDICGGSATACLYGNVGGQGTASIPVTVPNWAVGGVQELKVWAGGDSDTFNVTIVGPPDYTHPADGSCQPARQPGRFRVQSECKDRRH